MVKLGYFIQWKISNLFRAKNESICFAEDYENTFSHIELFYERLKEYAARHFQLKWGCQIAMLDE
jgi:hypothetical protein